MARWHPDTCACVIEFDDAATDTTLSIQAKCPKHNGISDATLLSVLRSHNRQKNSVWGWVQDNGGNYAVAVPANVVCDYASSVGPVAVDPVRVANHGLVTTIQRVNFQNGLDTQFGKGETKVI